MIPQAIANVGPYADLWSHLKSMQHALQRAIEASTLRDLSELDREHLDALAHFLRNELSQRADPGALTFAGLVGQRSAEPGYSLDIDLQQMIKSVPAFEQWHASQKLGFEKKWQRLVSALASHTQNLGDTLMPDQPTQEELTILQGILAELLLHVESALQV
jgi:hypothetical protein